MSEWDFVRQVCEEADCDLLCEELAGQHGDPDMAALTGTLLRRWVDEELLCAVIDPLCMPDTATAVL